MLNMDLYHTMEERLEVLSKLTQKMADSGYNKEARIEIIKSGLKRYKRMKGDSMTGGTKLYRSPEEMMEH